MLVDRFNRTVDYLRISVTDRCDFRCVYCMAEDMAFLPRSQVLSLEETYRIAKTFVALGVKKIRITGGEPLVRNNLIWLLERIAELPGLNELVMTTNGSQLSKYAPALKAAGVKRLNVSLDSLHPLKFKTLTRTGDLQQVIAGIDAACAQDFAKIKLNAVIMKGRNDAEIMNLVAFAKHRELDLAFIEEMPLGHIKEHDRALALMTSDEIRREISAEYQLTPLPDSTGGPSRYYQLADSVTRIGFISPHSNNFCSQCNRVRLTAEGRLLLCLGNEHSKDLRALVRDPAVDDAALQHAIVTAMDLKPERHEFNLEEEPQIVRFMNMTGG